MTNLAGVPVLVTGADGFIGSHLVERLARDGAHVRALCVYNSNGSYGWLDDLDDDIIDQVDLVLGDVRDFRQVQRTMAGVQVVFHLAALISIPYSYQAPGSFVETNVKGTLNVLEAARERGSVKIVNTSTSEVYGTPESIPIRESHPLRAQSPYAASKVAADQLSLSYACSFGTNVLTLRPFNTFGPRQSMRAVIPAILVQLLAGRRRIHLGSLAPRRDFTFVEDTVDGFAKIATCALEPGAVVQLGTGSAISIGDLFEQCREVVGVDAEVVCDQQRVRPQNGEVQVLLSDPERARRALGWSPRTSFSDGLRSTVDWLRPRVTAASPARYHQ